MEINNATVPKVCLGYFLPDFLHCEICFYCLFKRPIYIVFIHVKILNNFTSDLVASRIGMHR